MSAALAIVAPTAWYSASGMLAPAPAPVCTDTLCPVASSFFTVSGVAATRVSPAHVSAGMPIRMNFSYLVEFFDAWIWISSKQIFSADDYTCTVLIVAI